MILLSPPLECSDYRGVLPHLVLLSAGSRTFQNRCIPGPHCYLLIVHFPRLGEQLPEPLSGTKHCYFPPSLSRTTCRHLLPPRVLPHHSRPHPVPSLTPSPTHSLRAGLGRPKVTFSKSSETKELPTLKSDWCAVLTQLVA